MSEPRQSCLMIFEYLPVSDSKSRLVSREVLLVIPLMDVNRKVLRISSFQLSFLLQYWSSMGSKVSSAALHRLIDTRKASKSDEKRLITDKSSSFHRLDHLNEQTTIFASWFPVRVKCTGTGKLDELYLQICPLDTRMWNVREDFVKKPDSFLPCVLLCLSFLFSLRS